MQNLRLMITAAAIFLAFGTIAPLAAEEDGWQPLFNGEDFSGWQAVGGHMDDWSVEEGVMVLAGRTEGGAGWIATDEQYSNYELELDFKLYEGGNSGVFVRAPLEGHPSSDGLEIQLLDDDADKHADLHDWQYSGSVYGIAGPSRRVSRRPGEWQTIRIFLDNGQCVIHLNGEQIIDTNFDDHLDQADRWKGLTRRIGHIGLQSYGDRLKFRNIRIRELD